MIESDKKEFASVVEAVMLLYGRDATKPLLQLYWSALVSHDMPLVRRALEYWVMDPKRGTFMPKPADIIGVIQEMNGTAGGDWLTANEAWAQCLPAADEANSVVWTDEACKAWFAALPLLQAGDKVGARMAFVAAYDRNVAHSRVNGKTPVNQLSAGFDAEKRITVMKQAQETGLLAPPTPPADQKALPNLSAEQLQDNRQKIRDGMKELAASLAVAGKQRQEQAEADRAERMREVNERFDAQRAAVLAAINEDNGQ